MVRGVADGEREFFRKLLPAERLQLQGFPGSICRHLGSKTLFAAGNAYPVPFLVATMHPLLDALAHSSLDFLQWPPKLGNQVPPCITVIARKLRGRQRVAKKAKAKAKFGGLKSKWTTEWCTIEW